MGSLSLKSSIWTNRREFTFCSKLRTSFSLETSKEKLFQFQAISTEWAHVVHWHNHSVSVNLTSQSWLELFCLIFRQVRYKCIRAYESCSVFRSKCKHKTHDPSHLWPINKTYQKAPYTFDWNDYLSISKQSITWKNVYFYRKDEKPEFGIII